MIAVPTYQRAATLVRCTLALLRRHAIDPGRVTLFVADADEEAVYEALLPLEYRRRIVRAVVGMRAVRNFIQQFYGDGVPVVALDDDVRDVVQRRDGRTLTPVADLAELFTDAFALADRAGAGLWGVYPVANALFMKPTVTYDLRYVVGCLWGCWNSTVDSLAVTLDDKEDYERTLKWYIEIERDVWMWNVRLLKLQLIKPDKKLFIFLNNIIRNIKFSR